MLRLTDLDKVSTPRSSHISPLHHQAIRGRNIILTENPQLHLVWYYNQIFIKPVARYFLSYAFWQYLATQPPDIREAAIGFMRTYSYLVRYESDFFLAQEKRLIPKDDPSENRESHMSWANFARLISSFDKFGDEAVSPRYGYGELRLTRLNFYSRIFLWKLTFHHINAQWGTFLNGAVAPFFGFFIIISVILNAMQVELAVQTANNIHFSWTAFISVSKWFSVFALVFAILVIIFIFFLTGFFFVHDIFFAYGILKGKKKSPQDGAWRHKKSGVV